MSTVSFYVGQCGNQLGTAITKTFAREATDATDDAEYQRLVSSRFFRRGDAVITVPHRPSRPTEPPQEPEQVRLPFARAVLVDMEPKAVEQVQRVVTRDAQFRYDPRSIVTRSDGSANNWAVGYCQQGAARQHQITRAMRREVELCDSLGALQVVHSLAGGTGSGVGSLVSDTIAEHYPRAMLRHTVVWPLQQGEVATQWFNCALALHTLDENADAISIVSNDDAFQSLMAQASTEEERKAALASGFGRVNAHLAASLAAVDLPARVAAVPPPFVQERRMARLQRPGVHATPGKAGSSPARARTAQGPPVCPFSPTGAPTAAAAWDQMHYQTPFEIATSITANPLRKFYETVTVQSSVGGVTDSWSGVIPSALRAVFGRRTLTTEAAMLTLRGRGVMDDGIRELQTALANPQVVHGGEPALNSLLMSEQPFRKATAHASILHNSDSLGDRFAHCARRVEQLLQARAFVHHYEQAGLELDDLDDAVLHVWHLAQSYGYVPGMSDDEDD